MPYVDRHTRAQLLLYNRCRQNNILPNAGGVLDQDEEILLTFDLIDKITADHRRSEQERRETEIKAQEQLRRLRA